ncbi:hypothetical protein M436DRAFT_63420 [Aureobasidium namibiae CBS 147.97]|uniref:Uncharacterized protein n=1 Tax=Aureobasidium namibiae CBS 147.97 TaxID=1043004 RepID=A0A074WLV4_9PEZI
MITMDISFDPFNFGATTLALIIAAIELYWARPRRAHQDKCNKLDDQDRNYYHVQFCLEFHHSDHGKTEPETISHTRSYELSQLLAYRVIAPDRHIVPVSV